MLVSFIGGNVFTYHGGSTYTSNYSATYLTNSGYISAQNFSCYTVKNSGTINTYLFESGSLDNSGNVIATRFKCKDTINSGTINLSQLGIIDFGKFKIIKEGVFNFNGIQIKANEPLDPKVEAFLEKSSKASVTSDESGITLSGVVNFNIEEARKELPHLFSKFISTSPGYETIPGNWFSSSYPRVYSISDKTGEKEFWRFKTINKNFSLHMATRDVFTGLLSSKLLGENMGCETRFDVFSKIIVYKDNPQELESLGNEEKNNQILQKFIISEMSKSKEDFIRSIVDLCEHKQPVHANEGMLSWMYNTVSSIFVTPTQPMPIDTIRHVISKEQVLEHINMLLARMIDANAVCLEVKDEIVEDFKAVNCKYNQQQIDKEILPQIDALISNYADNIQGLKEYLELSSVKDDKARLVLR